jgi:hypothetical protein
MRTTLSIDDDVAALLRRLRKERNIPLKNLVNDALRRGLGEMLRAAEQRQPFHTGSVDLGQPRLANIDNIAEVLAIAEGDNFR